MGANKIIDGLAYDPDQGALAFNNVRYLLIRPETVIEFQKAVEGEVGAERCGDLIYQGGFAGGSLSTKRYRELLEETRGLSPLPGLDREAALFMCDMGGQIGWGRFVLETFDAEQGVIEVRVTGSPFAEVYGESDLPVCHFIRGVVGGMASVLLEKDDPTVAEIRCSASGGADCLFRASS